MRLHRFLPSVEPAEIVMPATCPYAGWDGIDFRHHQEVAKALRDRVYPEVMVHRYQCLGCKRTFRVYPAGVTKAQTSQRVQGLSAG